MEKLKNLYKANGFKENFFFLVIQLNMIQLNFFLYYYNVKMYHCFLHYRRQKIEFIKTGTYRYDVIRIIDLD